ncbi:MAG: glucose 1-dehydrogenase [Promethearchaeota archaeon]
MSTNLKKLPQKNLKGKNVIITGASKGIGQAIAIRFAYEGANTIINYRSDEEGARKTKAEVEKLGVKARIIKADVGMEDDVIRLISESFAEFGDIDVLVNNAAIQNEVPSHLRTTENFERTIRVNLTGVFIACREVIRRWLEKGRKGVIINISSAHEIIPKPGFIDYSISKGGLTNLTRTLALEYASKGIRVNIVAPGAVITPMNKSWAYDEEKRRKVEQNIPLGYATTPEEIAPAVVFLASDEAKYITGATLFVDGGAVLYPSYMKNWSS